MSSRVFAFRLAAAFLFAGVSFGAAPANAQYYYSGYSGCGACGTSYVVPQPRYYSSACGGCGAAYVAPQPQYYVAPQPRYYSSCGSCGSTAYYGGYYVQPPVVQQQYYTAPVAAPAYEEAVEADVVQPEFEQSPVYYGGERIYRRAAVDFRVNRRIERRVDRRIERRVDRHVVRRSHRISARY